MQVNKNSARAKQVRGQVGRYAVLSEAAMRTATEGFDIIIDDGSHIGELTKTTFCHLFHHHLKPGGLYTIEDWGAGYLADVPDGKRFDPKPSTLDRFPCHSHGMVGFVKELVDEQCAGSIALGRHEQFRLSNFETLLITEGVVFVTKMAPSLSASPNPVPTGKDKAKRRFHGRAWMGRFTFR